MSNELPPGSYTTRRVDAQTIEVVDGPHKGHRITSYIEDDRHGPAIVEDLRANEKIEQQATLFGMVVATFLGAPEGDVTLLTHLWAAVEHLAKKYEIDAYEHCTTAVMMIAMSGAPVPANLDARIARLKR